MASAEFPKPWRIDLNPGERIDLTEKQLMERVDDLSVFLSFNPIRHLVVDSVIPSAHSSPMYILTIGREDEEGEIDYFTTDSQAVNALEKKLLALATDERLEHKQTLKNIQLIENTVSDPFNWGFFIAGRKDH